MRRNLVLTEQERAILAGLGTVGVTSVTALADATNLRAHSARHGLQSLLERKLLHPFCSINPATLGFNAYITYFSLAPSPLATVEEALRAMVKHQNVSWVGEMAGTYQYGCTIYARDAVHAMSLLERITSCMDVSWQKKSITQRIRSIFWPLKFFSTNPNSITTISYPPLPPQHEIDQLDHQLLSLKGQNPTMSNHELSRLVGSASSTVTYRIEQLVQRGIILGSWYMVDWNRLGLSHSEVSLLTKDISPEFIEELCVFGRQTRNCHFVVVGLGDWDFHFNILWSHPEELQTFTSSLWAKYGNRIETLSVSGYTRILKYSTYPFTELGGERSDLR